ncbi:hypothetical protein BKA70DRAFT_1426757 [Coprinopsis sp. MPI-PUGE-AT-0042]|nr:hypothetical protein BKA70DRAFT_1426757 [Coprinopsis sp. MPI-PUGE-AT-0042]
MELSSGDMIRMVRSLPALQFISVAEWHLLRDEYEETFGEGQKPLVHRSICSICLTENLSRDLFDELACPALERMMLNQSSSQLGCFHDGVTDDSARALGRLILGSQTSAISLHLSGLFPPDFLSLNLSTSGPKIRELHLATPSCLPLNDGTGKIRLALPRSIHCIHCVEGASGDVNSWMKQLALSLEDPSHQTITV